MFKILVTGGVSIGGGLLTDKIVKNFHNHRAGSFNQSQNYSPSQRRLPSQNSYSRLLSTSLNGATFYPAAAFGNQLYIERDTPLNFHQALVLLGISAGINAVTYNSVFMYNKNPDIERYLCSSGATYWGIYVEDQMAAEGFAFLFGSTINPEIGRDIPI